MTTIHPKAAPVGAERNAMFTMMLMLSVFTDVPRDKAAEPLGQEEAAAMAGQWWSFWYRGEGGCGGAIIDFTYPRGPYVVGIYDLPDRKGHFYWFGQGHDWESAFVDALKHGYAPTDGPAPKGEVDYEEIRRFLDTVGLEPWPEVKEPLTAPLGQRGK